jgi:hypothetical protein
LEQTYRREVPQILEVTDSGVKGGKGDLDLDVDTIRSNGRRLSSRVDSRRCRSQVLKEVGVTNRIRGLGSQGLDELIPKVAQARLVLKSEVAKRLPAVNTSLVGMKDLLLRPPLHRLSGQGVSAGYSVLPDLL